MQLASADVISSCICLQRIFFLFTNPLNNNYPLLNLSSCFFLCLYLTPPRLLPPCASLPLCLGSYFLPTECARENKTLCTLSCSESSNKTLIFCVCLSPDSGVRWMSSKCILHPRGVLTRAGCTVYNKRWDVAIPHKFVKSERAAFCQTYKTINWTVVPWDHVRPEKIQFPLNVFDFLCTRVL